MKPATTKTARLTRRQFLKVSAVLGGGMAIGAYLPARAQRIPDDIRSTDINMQKPFEPNAWIRITPDNVVTLIIDKSEMGQGVMTALPMLLAEELEVELDTVKTMPAPAAKEYKNPALGMQATGGSTSVASSWQPLRQAGAVARAMLVTAAATQWGVPIESCRAQAGRVVHGASGRQATYGELATRAAELPVPDNVAPKEARDYRLIGKPQRRLDTPSKVDGSAEFGIDVRVPDMLIATIAQPPRFGDRLARYDAVKAKAVPGVRAVLTLDGALVAVARDYWSASKALKAANPQWRAGKNAKVSSASIDAQYKKAARREGVSAAKRGNAKRALAAGGRKLEAEYRLPFAAHATMEPMNCTAHVRPDGCDVWVPTQSQTGVQMTAAQITGLAPEKIQVHTTLLGCGFGRRFEQDFVAQAVKISKAVKKPIKLVWSREEDMTHDFYRPAVYNRLHAALDDRGRPVAWMHRIVSSSIMGRAMPQMVKGGLDPSSVEGAAELPYTIPNLSVDYVRQETGIPVGFWRSVGNSHTAFVVESFLDELAAAAKQDPVAFRRALLPATARERAVLDLAADKAGWGTPLPAGRARGIAVHKSFGSYVAQVAEVSVQDGKVRVHRVVCAADCGTVVDPNIVVQQMEGAIVYGLSATLYGPISIAHGGIEQRNFDTYPVLRINECPDIEVHLLPSDEAPAGVGEPGVPPIAPAVTNALFALTGRRIRQLPIDQKIFTHA